MRVVLAIVPRECSLVRYNREVGLEEKKRQCLKT